MAGKKMSRNFFLFFQKSSILKNFISLSVAELISKIMSLITFVYLARVLSPEGFGIIGFSTAFVSYFILIVNYGFETYGTREIAKEMENQERFVNSIISIKIIIALLAFGILTISTFLLNKGIVIQLALIITGINLFTTAFSVNWFFHGNQRMGYITGRQIFTSIMNLILIYFIINDKADVLLTVFITSFLWLINSLWLLGIYNKAFFKFHFELNKNIIKKIVKDSTPLAFSSIMIAVYYNLDMVMLGFMKTDREVGIYNAAFRIFLIGNISYNLLLKAFFPVLTKKSNFGSKDFNNLINNYFFTLLSFGIITSTCFFFFSNELISSLFGSGYVNSFVPLKIFAMNSLVVCVNIIFCNPLIILGKQKEYLAIVTSGALLNVLLNFIFIPTYSYIGAAYATLLSEVGVFVSALIVYFFKMRNFNSAI